MDNNSVKNKQVKLKNGIEVLLSERSKVCECGDIMFFAKTSKGKYMPVSTDYHGEWESHFGVCPLADKYRAKKRR